MTKQYSSSKQYKKGDLVSYHGDEYRALRDVSGRSPWISEIYWEKIKEERKRSSDDDSDAITGAVIGGIFGGLMDFGGSSSSSGFGGGGGDFGGGGASGDV